MGMYLYQRYYTNTILESIYSSTFLDRSSILHEQQQMEQKYQLVETWTNGIRDISLQGTNGKVLFFVHGTNSVSNKWIPIMIDFHQMGYTVIAMDVPTFGLSDTIIHVTESPCTILNEMDTCLYRYFEQRGLLCLSTHVTLVGHSFGGFLMSHFLTTFPETGFHLLLVNTAGLLPTLGANGAYWAIFFKLGMLTRPLRMGYGCLTRLFYPILQDPNARMYLRVLGNQFACGDWMVSQFITMRYSYSFWNRPLVRRIVSSKIKVGTICGGNDMIMPSHVGMTLRSITNILCYILPPMGHSFYYDENMVVAMKECMEHLHEKDFHEFQMIDIPQKLELFQGCSYSISQAKQVIQQLYNTLHREDIHVQVVHEQSIHTHHIPKSSILFPPPPEHDKKN